MKKTTFAFFALSLLAIASCRKNGTTSYGSYSFKSATINVNSCQPIGANQLSGWATASSISEQGLNITFGGGLPTAAAIDTVVSGQVAGSGRVSIQVGSSTGILYQSTGYGSNQTVKVTLPNGKVSVSGAAIEVVNETDPTDSASLTFIVTEQ